MPGKTAQLGRSIINDLLPSLDVWLDVPLSEIQHVVHILPTLDWNGGLLGVRLKYQVELIAKLKADYVAQRSAALEAGAKAPGGQVGNIQVWPTCLTEFLERRLRTYIALEAFALDPAAHTPPSERIGDAANITGEHASAGEESFQAPDQN